MMAADLFADLSRRGVVLELSAGRLRYRAPQGALTTELREAMKAHKDALLSLLTPDETLPDEIYIPASIPNDLESIATRIDLQRHDRRAAQ